MSVLAVTDDLVVVDKPAGLPVIPDRDRGPSLHAQLQAERGERLWICHRLDRDTTGVVVFARNAAAHRALSMAFERHEVEKEYVAIVVGHPAPASDTIDAPLHPARKSKMRLAAPDEAGALPSVTHYETLATGALQKAPVALVRLRPRTGRQHQLRVHLRSREHPIIGDALYGTGLQQAARAAAAGLVTRQLLHAASLRVTLVGRPLAWSAPWPADLRAVADAAGLAVPASEV